MQQTLRCTVGLKRRKPQERNVCLAEGSRVRGRIWRFEVQGSKFRIDGRTSDSGRLQGLRQLLQEKKDQKPIGRIQWMDTARTQKQQKAAQKAQTCRVTNKHEGKKRSLEGEGEQHQSNAPTHKFSRANVEEQPGEGRGREGCKRQPQNNLQHAHPSRFCFAGN